MSTKRKRRESNDEDVDGIFGTTPLNAKQRYRRIVYVPSIQTLIGSSSSTQTNFQHSFKWDHFLEEIRKQTAKDVELPGSLFGNPPMGSFLKAIQPGIKLEVRHYDYDALFPEKKIYWIASVLKIVGYRLLLRYEGMDKPGDDHRFDFWINLASDELQHVGYCKIHSVPCDLLPQNEIRERYDDWSSYISKKLINCKTLLANWEEERQIALVEGRFKVGTRLELLDRQSSDSLRPARVIQQLGRRICVRVSSKDVNEKDLGDDLAQIKTGIWCDESWELIFPVGWGRQNGWKVVANNQYLQHCEQIALAISQDRLPDYMPFDAMPEIFACGKDDEASSINTNLKENKAEWEVGMKFECLDPLNESFLELKVATCIEILKDGYLKIGFDGPDMESEAIPFHCTSPYLFPIYYANKYGIKLTGPLDNMKDFCWDKYIKQCQGIAAPESLFDKVPSPNEMEGFKIGSKLEATDQCESNLICPATIRAVRGRLLQIHFDGWGNDYDQLFDYRSRDLFPLGWCEIYGYKLEIPQNDEPLNTRKRR